jgi:peptidoglycan/LPS O-acetylase OafA/YrhL
MTRLTQGLRGIACVAVVFSHGFEAFGWPANSFDGRPYILTLPILRLFLQGGYMAVGVFFVMSGYVCSIKPLKLARQGKADEVRKVIGSSIFRRQLRLGLPATIATTISWTVDRLGGFSLARSLPGNVWLCFHTPVWMDFSTSVRALFSAYVYLF